MAKSCFCMEVTLCLDKIFSIFHLKQVIFNCVTTVWPWVSYLTFLVFSFFIYWIGIKQFPCSIVVSIRNNMSKSWVQCLAYSRGSISYICCNYKLGFHLQCSIWKKIHLVLDHQLCTMCTMCTYRKMIIFHTKKFTKYCSPILIYLI